MKNLPKKSKAIKLGSKQKIENFVKELEDSVKDFDKELLNPESHASHSVFRQCSSQMLAEIVRMCTYCYPSTKIAKYIYDNNEEVRKRYTNVAKHSRLKDGTPETLARSVRLFREKFMGVEQRFPEFNIDLYLQRNVRPVIDTIHEMQVLIALQKERISDAHALEKKTGVNSIQVTRDIVALRQIILDYVRLHQFLGIELYTQYKNHDYNKSEKFEEIRKSEHYKDLTRRLDEISKDPEVQALIIEKATNTYSLRRRKKNRTAE